MKDILSENIRNLTALKDDSQFCNRVEFAIDTISSALNLGAPLLVFGNGGSAADALHITGELVGRFNIERRGLNVICLNANVTVITAWSNDVEFDSVFARQIEAHGHSGGVAWGLSTSGNSPSVVEALKVARIMGLTTIAMTGSSGGRCAEHSDILLNFPSYVTPRIQELHLPVYHYMCMEIEKKCSN
jgi:D-sedoheptulose 7-phosphate isomerase